MTPERKVKTAKCLINNKTKEKFENALQEITPDNVISSKQTILLMRLSSTNSLNSL